MAKRQTTKKPLIKRLIRALSFTLLLLAFICIVSIFLTNRSPSSKPNSRSAENIEHTPVPSATPAPTNTPAGKMMYFCGYDHCRDSGEYGQLIFEIGINVWNGPDPDRGGVHHKAAHHDQVFIIQEKRINEGPGGLWYELQIGGWTNDFWLTDQPCTTDNLQEYSFTDCLLGKY